MSEAKQRAVIFDMDGVIVDSEPHHERAFHAVVQSLGYADHGIEFSRYVGRSDFELWQDFIAINKPTQSLNELLQEKRRLFAEVLREQQPIFAGVPELVAKVQPHYSLAVASGSERPIVNAVLELRNLRSFFPVIVTGGDVARGKPAPDIFLRTAELLKVPPRHCWVIEDSKPGVAAARAAGMRVIAITNTHPAAELMQADYVVSGYDEIEELLMPQQS